MSTREQSHHCPLSLLLLLVFSVFSVFFIYVLHLASCMSMSVFRLPRDRDRVSTCVELTFSENVRNYHRDLVGGGGEKAKTWRVSMTDMKSSIGSRPSSPLLEDTPVLGMGVRMDMPIP